MADTKISALTAIGTLGNDDLFAVVDDPAGTPLSRKVTGDNLKTFTSVLDQYSADAVDRELTFNKSRNATNGSHTVVQTDDDLGTIRFRGSDGVEFLTAAMILAEVDAALTGGGTDDMPGRLTFWTTPDGSATPVDRMRINRNGATSISNVTGIEASALLTVYYETGTTNGVERPFKVTFSSTGTPANNIGVGIDFEVETGVGNLEVGSRIDAVAVDTTSTNEDFDLVFNCMAAGAAAAERFRIKSTNVLVSPSGQVAHFWVYWTGASTTILASHNVTSIDNDATGDAGINLTTAFSSNNYAAFVCTNETGTDGWDADSIQSAGINVHTSATVDVLCGVMIDGTTAVGNTTNPDQWQACGFGVSA